MSITCKAVLDGNHAPVPIMQLVSRLYGGDGHCIYATHNDNFYEVRFNENHSAEVMKLRPFERAKHRRQRTISMFNNGYCMEDYADVTTDPATLLTVGASGDGRKVLECILSATGGYLYDEMNEDEGWLRIDAKPAEFQADAAA